jgi:hypothetical protein
LLKNYSGKEALAIWRAVSRAHRSAAGCCVPRWVSRPVLVLADPNVRYWQILLKNYSGKEALALWRSMCRFGLAAFGA